MYLLLRGVGRNKWSDVCAVPDLTPHISATRLHRRGFGLGKRLPQCLSRESSPGSCFFCAYCPRGSSTVAASFSPALGGSEEV